jgi:hypothetical protein
VGNYFSAPYCTLQLADLGAEVVKVENPVGGDFTRSLPPFDHGESGNFVRLNRNKRSLALDLKDPEGVRIFRALVATADAVVHDDRALHDFTVRPRGIRDVLARALVNEDLGFAATRWSDALSAQRAPRAWGGAKFRSRLVDSHAAWVDCTPPQAFEPIARIGGNTGWYYGHVLWRLRGLLDLAVGGPGMRRGRRDPKRLLPGDALDFWRVEAWEPGRLLRLAAEMRLPGRAWLQFEVTPADGGSLIRQTAMFDPVGVWGLLYWYGLWGIHQMVFAGMLRNIARAAARPQSHTPKQAKPGTT